MGRNRDSGTVTERAQEEREFMERDTNEEMTSERQRNRGV